MGSVESCVCADCRLTSSYQSISSRPRVKSLRRSADRMLIFCGECGWSTDSRSPGSRSDRNIPSSEGVVVRFSYRRLAQRGIPMAALLRAYLIGSTRFPRTSRAPVSGCLCRDAPNATRRVIIARRGRADRPHDAARATEVFKLGSGCVWAPQVASGLSHPPRHRKGSFQLGSGPGTFTGATDQSKRHSVANTGVEE
jgi:hypothetical protein